MTLTFSQRGQALIGQAMFSILDKARQYEQQGHKVFHLELGDPAMAPPPSIIEGTVKALRDGKVGYCSPAGLMELRERVVELSNDACPRDIYGWENVAISPTNLLISQVLDIVCDLSDDDLNTVGLFYPVFPTYLAACKYQERFPWGPCLVQEDGFQLSKDNIDALITGCPGTIIVNSGNNPTGAVYDSDVLQYLLECCMEKNIWLIADETYQYLSQVPYYSLLETRDYERLIIISSFSKVLSIPAYRTGWVVAHPEVIEKITLSTSTLYSCLPIFNQLGILAGMNDFHAYAAKAREHYGFMNEAITQIINPSPVLSCHLPQSAFYLFIDIRKTGLADIEFAERLMEDKHVAITPGEAFGYPGFIRISTCGPWDDVLEGVRRLVEFAGRYRERGGE